MKTQTVLMVLLGVALAACTPGTSGNPTGALNATGSTGDKKPTVTETPAPCSITLKQTTTNPCLPPTAVPSAAPLASTAPAPSASASPFRFTAMTTFAGSGKLGYADGPAATAQFDTVGGLAFDSKGNLYVADTSNHRIRKITPDGTVSTVAGSEKPGYMDGPGLTAKFYDPVGLVIDKADTLYVSERTGHRIRKIAPDGTVSTLAGSEQGYKNGTGKEAQFYAPEGLAFDESNNLYVADKTNHLIRKVTSEGVVTTFAGVFDEKYASGFADGTVTTAKFKQPSDIARAPNGDFYVADSGNHRIRKITPDGTVSTVAGQTIGFKDGLRDIAEFKGPDSITLDPNGNLYGVEFNNSSLRMITPEGMVTTLSGMGGSVQGTLKADKPLVSPMRILSYGKYLYIADNHTIRRVE